MTTAYINRVATCVPPHDVHEAFVRFARALPAEPRARSVFDRMAARSQISHRYSYLPPSVDREDDAVDATRVYAMDHFPSTARRMELFEEHAPTLAVATVAKLDLGVGIQRITHVIVTSCTGMYAPGLDLDLVMRCGISPSAERTMIGFMGCYAAINALKLSRHIVRSTPEARVLIVNLELCSLHFQQADRLEPLLSFLIFGDGCAAALVSADPVGLSMDRFYAALLPETRDLITWKVRDDGFDMFLSGRVPRAIAEGLPRVSEAMLDGASPESIERWAVHPGGRTVLDAVEHGLGLAPTALNVSRSVLDDFGNMSSATVMFVLASTLELAQRGDRGCAMSFGPGLTAETMLFRKA